MTNDKKPTELADVVAAGASVYADVMTFGGRPFVTSFLEAGGWRGRDALAGLAWLLDLLERQLFEDPAPAVQNAPWRTEAAWRRLREALETVRAELASPGTASP